MHTVLPPGFRMRNASIDDLPAVVAVGRACDLADLGEFQMHEDWVHDEWVRPNFDPSSDAWVVSEPRGEVVAFTYTWDEGAHMLFDTAGWVHPAYRGRGIGTALVGAVERRALRDVEQLPAGSTSRVQQSYDADASGALDPDASGARVLFERLGYAAERQYLHMQIDVTGGFSAGEAPAGITIRPRIEADDRAIVDAMVEVWDEPWEFEDARNEWAASKTYDPTLWLVALDGEETVGAAMAYVSEGRGFISGLVVREAWRRRGIGGAILRASFATFRDRGITDVRLNVDQDNPTGATHLYERAGMRLRRRWIVVAKTLSPTGEGGPATQPITT